jgi:hypothetical protein
LTSNSSSNFKNKFAQPKLAKIRSGRGYGKRVTSLWIANAVSRRHRNLLETIREHGDELGVAQDQFRYQVSETPEGGRPLQYLMLTLPQAIVVLSVLKKSGFPEKDGKIVMARKLVLRSVEELVARAEFERSFPQFSKATAPSKKGLIDVPTIESIETLFGLEEHVVLKKKNKADVPPKLEKQARKLHLAKIIKGSADKLKKMEEEDIAEGLGVTASTDQIAKLS